MPVIGLTSGSTWVHYLSDDEQKNTPDGTKFILGTIPKRLEAQLSDEAMELSIEADDLEALSRLGDDADAGNKTAIAAMDGDVGLKVSPSQQAYETVRHGLKGWENFPNADGEEIPFETEDTTFGGRKVRVVTRKAMESLRLSWIRELSTAIAKGNTVPKEAAKD